MTKGAVIILLVVAAAAGTVVGTLVTAKVYRAQGEKMVLTWEAGHIATLIPPLEYLLAGRHSNAIEILEGQLDTSLMTFSHAEASALDQLGPVQSAIKQAKRHREKHPYINKDSDVATTVNELLSR